MCNTALGPFTSLLFIYYIKSPWLLESGYKDNDSGGLVKDDFWNKSQKCPFMPCICRFWLLTSFHVTESHVHRPFFLIFGNKIFKVAFKNSFCRPDAFVLEHHVISIWNLGIDEDHTVFSDPNDPGLFLCIEIRSIVIYCFRQLIGGHAYSRRPFLPTWPSFSWGIGCQTWQIKKLERSWMIFVLSFSFAFVRAGLFQFGPYA